MGLGWGEGCSSGPGWKSGPSPNLFSPGLTQLPVFPYPLILLLHPWVLAPYLWFPSSSASMETGFETTAPNGGTSHSLPERSLVHPSAFWGLCRVTAKSLTWGVWVMLLFPLNLNLLCPEEARLNLAGDQVPKKGCPWGRGWGRGFIWVMASSVFVSPKAFHHHPL